MSSTLAKDFRAWLTSQAIIAQTVKGRVLEDSAPDDDAKPYIVFHQTGAIEETDLDGVGGLEVVNFDLEVRADRQAEADVIANEVKRLINGFPQATLEGHERKWNGRGISFAAITDHSKDYEILPVGSFETDSIHALLIEVYADG
jgi:hypothetical protein